ncbi:MAG: hypothetical protein MPEBLZ_02101 [Candidatus Methanoperedens nitroreducens]|uniref:Prenyltransferase and squalene oxidase repeat protein n=1 Tax=Candidatus Methanoperedens nitratireducens TaxID=1392998 RepID=A0A0P7ZHW2_9EURY|nr:prenyltransferase/squalene oxidase repeat-containing protein [Candidatus Methanoperedens sp. BLZ2]KAB2944233.1 MAG: terpene cyclase/mutase family protein [Candidatus Methanoperedens sp.]KPQ43343.1 MAG: hypothetical protein MPEBLZ_02101 [Candidatus Methanoperedens sp. BLZ1]MBZ0174633.1 terpene cyclase/mutase family protein [Candidatus Methanoperedens nitroreducens]MCX9076909.1 terpene cyclase/mutase family protein [Candidatus Methanoperedens sp.]
MDSQINKDECRLNALSGAGFKIDITGINIAASRGLVWLKEQQPEAIKDISRSVQALTVWNESASTQIEKLLSLKKDGYWKTQTPLTDTARACIALCGSGKVQPETVRWIREQQRDDNWNNSEIDTAYALMALGECRIKNENGCNWLVSNYGKKWEHPGTTSLIITALSIQNKEKYRGFLSNRASWLLSKKEDGGWTYIATSNLVIQALILAGTKEEDITPSIKWLLGKQQENGSWKDIISTTLSLITLKMYLDKLNSISKK